MIATLNCPGFRELSQPVARGKIWFRFMRSASTACLLALFMSSVPARAELVAKTDPPPSFAERAQKRFSESRTQFRSNRGNPEFALSFGLAAFDHAEYAADSEQREEIALEGIAACRSVVASQPESAAGHYYLAMNLGQLARTKTLGALRLVSEMETEFQISRDLDENFDFAGPDRNLGLLYSEAPGWPTSIGSRSKARHHLHRAVVLKPDYPENRLNLLEAHLKWGDKARVSHEFQALKELWPKAKQEFTGEPWEASWADWDMRWGKIQIKYPTEKAPESPRNKK